MQEDELAAVCKMTSAQGDAFLGSQSFLFPVETRKILTAMAPSASSQVSI